MSATNPATAPTAPSSFSALNVSSSYSPYSLLPYSSQMKQGGRGNTQLIRPQSASARPKDSSSAGNVPSYARLTASYTATNTNNKPTKPTRPASASVRSSASSSSSHVPPSQFASVNLTNPAPYEIHRPRKKHHRTDDFKPEYSSSSAVHIPDASSWSGSASPPASSASASATYHPILSAKPNPHVNRAMYYLNKNKPIEAQHAMAGGEMPSDSMHADDFHNPPSSTAASRPSSAIVTPVSPNTAAIDLGFGTQKPKKRPTARPASARGPDTSSSYVEPRVGDRSYVPPPPSIPEGTGNFSITSSALASPSFNEAGDELKFNVDWEQELRLATSEASELGSVARSSNPESDIEADTSVRSSPEGSPQSSNIFPPSSPTHAIPLFIRQKMQAEKTAANKSHPGNATGEEKDEVAPLNASTNYEDDVFLNEDDVTPVPLASTSKAATAPLNSFAWPSPATDPVLNSSSILGGNGGTGPAAAFEGAQADETAMPMPPSQAARARIRAHFARSHRTTLATARALHKSIKQVEDFLVGQVALANEIAHEYHMNRMYKALKISVETATAGGVRSNLPSSNGNKITPNAGNANANEDASVKKLNKHLSAISGGAAVTTGDNESKFCIRVYQVHPLKVLRDVALSQFNRELAHLIQSRDAAERKKEHALSSEQKQHVTHEGEDTSLHVALNLKSILLETMSMTDALSAQVQLLRSKGIFPIQKHTPNANNSPKKINSQGFNYAASTANQRAKSPHKHPQQQSAAESSPPHSPYFNVRSSRRRPLSAR